MRHLATCGECSGLVLETAAALRDTALHRPASRTAHPRRYLAAAATLLAVTAGVVLWQREPTAAPLARSLLREHARTTSRYIEARLIDLPYRPLTLQRGPAGVDARLLALAYRAEEEATRTRTPESLHTFGVAALVTGRAALAERAFAEALQLATNERDTAAAIDAARDPVLLSDYAAAALARTEDHDATLRALEASDRAASLQPVPAAAWNRALALEHVHLRSDARAAWRAYLVSDTASGWTAEARTRLAALTPTAAQWPRIREALLAGTGNVDLAAQEFPGDVRTLLEDDLLPAWARATGPEAAATLRTARRCADALVRTGGDPLARDTLVAIQAATPAEQEHARAGILALQEGTRAYRARDIATARSRTAVAFRELAHLPLCVNAALRLASCAYYENQYDAVHRQIVALRAAYPAYFRRYPAWAGQVEWLAGLEALARGSADTSAAAYARALASFEHLRETANIAAVHELIAENRDWVGDTDATWQHATAALDSFDEAGTYARGVSGLTLLAEAAIRAKTPQAALRFVDAIVRRTAPNDDLGIAYAHLWHAVISAEVGNSARAHEDLRRAAVAAHAIGNPDVRARVLADAAVADAHVSTPATARLVQGLDAAIALYDRGHNGALLAQALISRARVHRALRDDAAAIGDLRQAIGLIEDESAGVADPWLRATYFRGSRIAGDELVDLLLAHARTTEALAVADGTRVRALTSISGVAPRHADTPVQALAASLPADVRIIEYASRENQTYAWIVTRDGITFYRLPASREALVAATKVLTAALTGATATDTAWRHASSALSRMILDPLAPALRGGARIVIVPDATLENVPFAVLVTRTGELLIDTAEVRVVPAARYLRVAPQRRAPIRVAVFGDPTFDAQTFPGLPRLAEANDEAARIGRVWPSATVARGRTATRGAFLDALAGADLVHYAGHAIAADRPAQSRLVLAPDAINDGVLTAADILSAPRCHARVVILSACSAGHSATAWSEGASSLAKAFVGAGAASVASPLWDLPDSSAAAAFFTELHRELARHRGLAAAARTVQVVARQRGSAPPSVWASLAVIDCTL